MELKILEEKNNQLFNRKEVKASVNAEVAPSRAEIEKLLSEKYSAKEGAIKIKGIRGRFGSNIFNIEANIYASKEDRDRTEPLFKKKEKEAAKPKAPEQPAEKPAEEAPKEEPTPEPPQESKIEQEGSKLKEKAITEPSGEAKPEEKPKE
jgi:ribosomal protein S24E